MFIDTHSHLNFKDFDNDWGEVAKRSLENNTWLINASSNFLMSKRAIEIAESFETGVYASAGLHPLNATVNLSDVPEDKIEQNFDVERYKKLASSSKKVVAIGEIGLDGVAWEGKEEKEKEQIFEKQKQILREQIKLADELGLPIILHCRKAHQNLIEILKNFQNRGVVHCFTGNLTQAKEYIDMGFYLGFNGIIFKRDLNDIIKKMPLESMLLETDCPFLSPLESGEERNEPMFVKYVAKRIAEIKNETIEKVESVTTENAKKLFVLN